jgi:hypothetical protein
MALALPHLSLQQFLLLLLLSTFSAAVILVALPAQGAAPGGATAFTAEETWAAGLPDLLQQTSAIVYGHVVATQSRWDETQATIVTDYTVAIIETLLPGDTPLATDANRRGNGHLVLEAQGGFLAQEGLGLWVSHGVTLAADEDLLLLLDYAGEQFQVSGGEWGKYTVQDGLVRHEHFDLALPVATFLQTLQHELRKSGRQLRDTHASQAALAAPSYPISQTAVLSYALQQPWGDPPRWLTSGVELAVKVNLNSAQIDEVAKPSADFYMAIRQALRTWSLVESADFTLLYDGETTVTDTGYNGENEIVFVHTGKNKPLGQAQIWYTADNLIVEVDIRLNDDYQFSVDDEPALNEVDLESVVLHELGHWAPLDHSTNPVSVMYSVLGSMERKRILHADDTAALTQLYPCDLLPCIHETHLTTIATPTPRPNPTATPTIVPTVATPTLVPTTISTLTEAVYLPFVAR